jgi:DNA repair exonuclease SbcCD nuclease subunit
MKKKKRAPKKKPAVIVCSDTHLSGESAWSRRPQINGDDLASFRYIVNYAITKGAYQLIIAGDVFDKRRPGSKAVAAIAGEFDKLFQEDVKVYFNQGQHDLSDPPWPTIHHHPEHIHEWQFELGYDDCFKIAYGLDWQGRADFQESLKQIPDDVQVLITHQVYENFMGSMISCEGSFSDIPGHIELLITGDYHKTVDKVYHNRDGNEMRVLSPGSTHMRAIDEPPDKYFFAINSDGSITRHTIPTRKFIEYREAMNDEELQKIIVALEPDIESMIMDAEEAQFEASMLKPLVRVRYSVDIENAHSRLKKTVDDKAHLFEKELLPEEDEEVQVARAERRETRAEGLLGCLPLAVDDEEEPELYSDLERLIQSQDVKVELQKMKAEALGDD